MTPKELQSYLATRFDALLPDEHEVEKEWVSFRGGNMLQYSPRVDVAVGPFSIEHGQNRINEYNQAVENEPLNGLLRRLFELHRENVIAGGYHEIEVPDFGVLIKKNQNARCLLALEIESQNSRKHIMGSIVNAASLGRIGMGIGYTDKAVRTFLRISSYLSFLKRVEKNTYDTTNFLVLSVAQIRSLLD
ncbi:MAG: hypothetical protein JNK00_00005 [Flavipsychrobacter sp.]|nr:hypothetical protein [Flavipsychrobacter sp.]